MRHRLEHTKSVWANGREYLYFVTTRTNAKGNPILVRLPARSDPSFGAVYGAHLAALSRKATEVLMVPGFVRMFMYSQKFRSLSAGSQRVYGIYLERFADELAPAPADEIERKDILAVTAKMKPGAANTFVKTVNSLYSWGRKWQKVTADPCSGIDMNDMGEHDPWPDAALMEGLSASDDTVRLAVHLLLYTAQRIGDVCKMRWTDIAGERIRVTQEKTGKYLEIQLHSALAAELSKWPRSFDTILSSRGKLIAASTLRPRIQRYMTSHGFSVVPHGLRKNAVNALLEAGCSTAETSAISGQSLAMVEHYARRRNQPVLGTAAVLKWERGQNVNQQNSGKKV